MPFRPKSSKAPIRVLMLIENGSFPFDRRMRHLAEALHDGGYKVTVACPRGFDHDKGLIDHKNGITIYRFPMWFHASHRFGYIFEYSWALLCLSVLSLFTLLRDGVDIIHVANPPDILFMIALPYKLFGKKLVYDQHDLCPELYQSKFNRQGWAYKTLLALERSSYRAADLVLSTNESYRDIAINRGSVRENRAIIVRNGVDLKRFHYSPGQKELKRHFPYMALYLGIMGKQDGVDRVVEAANHVINTYGRKDVLFVFIGKGECWLELQALSQSLGIAEFMHFAGFVPDDLLLDYLSTADVCLAPDPPDRMNQLSTMTKIMEYMACQRPIVSFDLLETRRSAGDAAVYIPLEDTRLFAKAILDLLDDPALRRQMGDIGLQRTQNLVGLDKSRKALLEGYSRLTDHTTSMEDPAPAPRREDPVVNATK